MILVYDDLLESCKFLSRDDLYAIELSNRWMRDLIQKNQKYWPLFRCYRLTFLEYYAVNTLARTQNLSSFPFEIRPSLRHQLESIPLEPNVQIPLFLDEVEPTFLLFEFASGRKFYIELEPYLNAGNLERIAFWFDQIAGIFFTEEIRGLLDIRKFSPAILDEVNGLGKILRFRCKTLGCYEYEAFDQLSLKFMLKYMNVLNLDKANGTIYSPELMEFLRNGANCCSTFSTRWVMGCGAEFTDNLIQHVLNTQFPEKCVPTIRFTPSFHRQRDLPLPMSLVPLGNILLIKREFGDWKYEEWELRNVHARKNVHFRLCIFIYNDVETDEEAISQFSIERM